ncbi:MAG: hypothetical protein ABL967_18490 [Bryobacteraceae bacterium]
MTRLSGWLRNSLKCSLAVSGVILAARAAFGPFQFLFSVRNPIGAESVFGVSALLLLLLVLFFPGRTRGLSDNPHATPTMWPYLAGAVAAATALWAWSFHFPFIADDYIHTGNALHHSPGYFGNLFTVPATDFFFRPFVYVAYAVEGSLFGPDRAGWHAFSFGLHLGTGLLLYRVARETDLGCYASFSAMLFFLLHGSRPEAVAWLSAQFDLWAALFVCAALLASIRYSKSGNLLWQIASLSALLLGLLSKESAYVYPLIALLWWKLQGIEWRKAIASVLPAFALAACVFTYRMYLLEGIGGYRNADTNTTFLYNISLLRTPKGLFARTAAITLFPINWSVANEWWLIAALAAMLIAIAAVAFHEPLTQRIENKNVWFGLGFFLIAALPVHLFLLIDADLEKSRVLYLPMIGAALALASILDAMAKRWAIALASTVLVFHAAALEHNLIIWRGVADLAEQTCTAAARETESPGAVRITGVPNVIDGIYFLHTGFRKCVEQAAGREVPMLTDTDTQTAATTQQPDAADVVRSLAWDVESKTFQIKRR